MGSAIVYGYIALSLVFSGVGLWGIVLLTPVYVFAFLYVTSPESPIILIYGERVTVAQVDIIAEHLVEETGKEVLIYEVHK